MINEFLINFSHESFYSNTQIYVCDPISKSSVWKHQYGTYLGCAWRARLCEPIIQPNLQSCFRFAYLIKLFVSIQAADAYTYPAPHPSVFSNARVLPPFSSVVPVVTTPFFFIHHPFLTFSCVLLLTSDAFLAPTFAFLLTIGCVPSIKLDLQC
jgi:hypothetical protein